MEGKHGELDFLANEAEGLDLTNSEDRAIFRQRVAERLRFTRVDAMREWVNGAMRDRFSAARAVADAFIATRA